MKRRPECDRAESDDSLAFCRADGRAAQLRVGPAGFGQEVGALFGGAPRASSRGRSIWAIAIIQGLKGATRLPPHGLLMPALVIEFAAGVREVEDLLGPAKPDHDMRARISKGLYGDYLFIAMYWLLLVLMSVLLGLRGGRWAVWAGAGRVSSATTKGSRCLRVVER